MITLHHLENSRSFRILWLLEEMGLDYDLLHYRRDPDSGQAMADLREKHVLGKAPLLEDGVQVIVESGAIIEYLLDTYGDGSLRPAAGTPERIHYNTWMHAAEGSLMTLMILALFLNRMESRSPFFIKPFIRVVTGKVREGYLDPNLARQLKFVESELGRRQWFAGEAFSAADVQMGFVMTALAARGGLDQQYPNCQRWMGQMQERPAYQRAMEKNGEMKLLAD